MAKRTAREQLVIQNRRMLIYTFLLILVFLYVSAKQQMSGGETPAEHGFVLDEEDMWCLVLTNDRYPVPEDYHENIDLKEIPGSSQQVDNRILDSLAGMLSGMKAEGLRPAVVSGYRPRKERESSAAGEHGLGLAVDICSESCQQMEEEFGKTPEGVWLREHSWEYGFVLRYDRGKEEITGMGYAPWHYRYVGEKAAEYLYRTGMCLEEFYIAESLYG